MRPEAWHQSVEEMAGELLDIACERIMHRERPASIKDSELRFVAVNAAYARLFGRAPDEFHGLRSEDVDDVSDRRDVGDCERRALVFGTEETALFAGDGWFDDQVVVIERFMPADDRAFVFGLFGAWNEEREARDEPVLTHAPVREDFERIPAPPAFTPPPLDATVTEALDLIDIGLGVFDPQGRLVYCNAGFRVIYGEPCGHFDLGVTYRMLLERIYDYGVARFGDEIVQGFGTREQWVSGRIEQAQRPHYDKVEPACDGGWLRCVNRRLDDGSMIVLRLDVTAQKEQELALRRHIGETELFRSVLEEMPVAVFMRDAAHRLTFVNEAYADMVGAPRAELIGTTEAEVFDDAGRDFHAKNDDVLENGTLIQRDDVLPRRDGSVLPIITRMARIDTGTEKYVVGSMTDVSMLKAREAQLEEARLEAETLHRDVGSVLESMPVGILIPPPDLTIEFANPAFHEIWDYPAETVLAGSPFRDYVRFNFDRGLYACYGEDFEDVFQRRVRELCDVSENDQREVSIPNGKTLIITAKNLSGGKVLISYVDISAVRDSERRMQETRRELERVGQFMKDATCVMTQGLIVMENDLIVLSNEAAARILHVPPELVAHGGSASAIFDHCAARGDFGGDPEALGQSWRKVIADKHSFSHGFLAAGQTWVRMEANFSGQGHWMFVLNDLTEMKRREEELTALLARSEAADRAKSEFLANMSHEIRTPMNGVLGMAELLSRTQLDTRQRTFVDIIGKSGNALLTIINDILDFSKIDAGQMKLRKAPFDPVEAVEDVATLMSSAAADKDIELLVRCGPDVPQVVVGDAGRFRQIVTNLVGNAVKFTEMGYVLIDVTAEPDGEGAVLLGLRVEDTGIGIAGEKLDTIFEKFSQGDGSSTRRHDGTGLGRAITSGLVDLFGGYITVTSEPGRGSIFSVRLPMVAPARSGEVKGLPVNVNGARVLIIDDNAVSRGILEEQARRWGFDAFATGSGEEALALLQAAADFGVDVDAVVLDYRAQGMSGADIARAIRREPRFDDLAIIFLTSMDAVGDDDFFSALKVQAHLMKPARAKVLRSAIVDAVRAARIRRLSAAPDRPAITSTLSASVASAAAQSQAGGLDVLVAEDNEVNCIVFSQILQGLDLRFLIVNDGQQALEAWREHKPGVILMDVSMPVMNGHQATRAIRAHEGAAIARGETVEPVPIVGVTAHAHAADRDLCFQSGMNDYLSKPLSPEMLEEKIGRWLPRKAKASSTN